MTTTAPPPSALFRLVPALDALRTYSANALRADFVAGLTVATVAVPQAMAYAIVAGVPAEHGLYTAIVMTTVGALLDSSKQLINGPTNAISIAVLSALAAFPAEEKLAGAVTLALLIGAFQTLITLLRLGDLTRYISHSVVVGFTFGAGMLLVLDQIKNLVGLKAMGDAHDPFLVKLWHTWTEGGPVHVPTLVVGLATMAAVIGLRWLKARMGWLLFPDFLVVMVAAAGAVGMLGLDAEGVKVVGEIPAKLPAFQVPNITWAYIDQLWSAALPVAVLGLLEAIAMAKAIAAHTGQRLDLNQQCLSEGLANISASFFQCIPGSGSLTRSAINQQAGAATQWSGVWSAAAVALIVVLFAPWARYIPKAALAGMLIVSAWRMMDIPNLLHHARATRFDAIIIAATAFSAIAISIEFCITIGIVLSFLLAVPRAGQMSRTEFFVDETGVVDERKEGEPVPDDMLIFGLEGELFFGSAIALDEHFDAIEERAKHTRVVVLRVKRLRNPDAVGLTELQRFLRRMRAHGVRVLLCGVRADMHEGLRRIGILDELDPDQVFLESDRRGSSTLDAIRAARRFITTGGVVTPDEEHPVEDGLRHYLV